MPEKSDTARPGAADGSIPKREDAAPIKLPDPPEEKQPELPKVGSRDAPGG